MERRPGVDITSTTLYLRGMTRRIKPERPAHLEYLKWERQDYQEAAEAVRQGVEDVKAARTKPADEFLDRFARKQGTTNG